MRVASCKLGAVTETEARLTFVSKSMTVPAVTCTGGSVSVGVPDDRYANGGNHIATTQIVISGLSGNTKYSYAITQDATTIEASFKTMPDKNTAFSFIVQSCNHPLTSYGQRYFKQMRNVIDELKNSETPLAAYFHIDDVNYTDTLQCTDANSTIATTGKPQDTGLGRDYAVGWAHHYGLVVGTTFLEACGKTNDSDMHWVYQNIPSFVSGGDHAIADNHCRGALVNGVPNNDYHSCDRSAGGLEEVGKAEWDAFLGNGNPDPLRVDKWHWGAEIGCVKFALYDYSLYSQPYDSVLATDVVGYSAEQLGDIDNYLSAGDFDFKCHLMESPPTTYGQPWKNWHETEAAGWKTTFDANDKINGVDGNSVIIAGDNHALYNVKYDTFWSFCSGVSNGSNVVNASQETAGSIANLNSHWRGQNQFSEHAYNITGDRVLGGFWLFKVYPSDRIEAVCYSATGSILSPVFDMKLGSLNNQWTMKRAKLS